MSCKAQIVTRVLKPHFEKRKLGLKELPFYKVEVLDRRFDTSLFYYPESGDYPPEQIAFETSVSEAFEDYFNAAVSQIPHGDKTLLIKINQCRVPNRQLIKRKTGRPPWGTGRRSHENILFDADIFYKNPDMRYTEILHIREQSYVSAYREWLQEGVEKILNNIIKAVYVRDSFPGNDKQQYAKAKKSLKKDSLAYTFIYDTTSFTIANITAGTVDRWKATPIFAASLEKNGVFENFDDFKNNTLTEDSIIKDSLNNDSVFHFSAIHHSANGPATRPWAVIYNDTCFVNLFYNTYLPLVRESHFFYFYVPWTLPDMYAILSYECYSTSGANQGYALSGNIIAGIATVIAQAANKSQENHSVKKRTTRDGLRQDYRHCIIDLDNGDFIYSKKYPE